jgi:NADH:ubiquinone oxidoreductase subunit K
MDYTTKILLTLSIILLLIGVFIIFNVNNFIHILLGIELILNSSNINFIAFNYLRPEKVDGQIFIIVNLIIAVCETTLGIALIYNYYKFNRKITD